jgi:PAS domain S-box-containing protein
MKSSSEETTSELRLIKRQLQKMIEEHGQAILLLQESEEKFRTIADYTYNWEYWLSPEGDILYNSPSCEGLTGFSPEEFSSTPNLLLSIVHPDDQDAVIKHRECSCYTSKTAQHFVFRIVTKNGDIRWVAHSCQPVYNDQGDFLGRRASNRNITTQKRIEEQISLNEERFRLALDASSDGVWDRNLITDESYYGENWYHVLGYTEIEVKKKSLTWEELLHPDDKEKTMATLQQHLDGLTSRYETEFRMRNKAGEWQWFLSRGKVVEKSEDGKPLRFIGTHTDITKNKGIELELQNMQDILEKKVTERTNEILEVNIALKVLLKKMKKDNLDFEQKITNNIARLVDPYLQKLQNFRLKERDRIVIDMLSANLQELTSSFASTISSKIDKLTPTELQVANLVKHGKTTKEIAELMTLAPGTISIHRKSIRKKLGISQHNVNLQAYLSSET